MHINMYPPSRQVDSAGNNGPADNQRTAPYPLEDTQEVINPVPLQSRSTQSSIGVTSGSIPAPRVISPTDSRYERPFAFTASGSTDSLNRATRPGISATSSVETFTSASDMQKPPPPPYEETETQYFLREKAYRQEEDMAQEVMKVSPKKNPLQEPSRRKTPPPKNRPRDLSNYSEEALEFHNIYEITVNDSPKFTPEVQMKWCETLLTYSFRPKFISQYNINAEKLKRQLTPEETLKNQKIILEHALKVLTKLITLQFGPAMYLMGTLYSHQPYLDIKIQSIVAKNDTKALDYYSRAAELNHADACFRAGISYEYQRGTPPQLSKDNCLQRAVKYYELGADKCLDASCMYKLGMLYLHGLEYQRVILSQDVKKAILWFTRASYADTEKQSPSDAKRATQVSPQAMYELGKIYEFEGLPPSLQNALLAASIQPNPSKALTYYHRCATQCSYPLAQWKLGHCYEFGELNLPVIANKSIAWYAKAAMNKPRGNPMAMMALSGWYLTGASGVLQPNNQEAYNWALKACQLSEGKLARAQYALGFFCENGIGCPPSMEKAREHYHAAASAGHQKALERLKNGI